ncbi:hypothetical protein NL676_023360 [Syzygium grande]|nr:hypothetical protein NL676_023360 [Syzygium grande]
MLLGAQVKVCFCTFATTAVHSSLAFCALLCTSESTRLMYGYMPILLWLARQFTHIPVKICLVPKGNSTLYLALSSHKKNPGTPQEFHIFPNSTFHIPFDDAHQEWDTKDTRISKLMSSYLVCQGNFDICRQKSVFTG